LIIIPVLNKIDLPGADIERSSKQLLDVFGLKGKKFLLFLQKDGKGVKELLKRVIEEISAPRGDISKSLKAVLFDSSYDSYKGVILFLSNI